MINLKKWFPVDGNQKGLISSKNQLKAALAIHKTNQNKEIDLISMDRSTNMSAQYMDGIIPGQRFRGNDTGAFENMIVKVIEVCNLRNEKYDILVSKTDGTNLLIDEDMFRFIFEVV